jgi:hypothetical protein
MFLCNGALRRDMQTVVGQDHVQYLGSVHLELIFELMQLSLFFHATMPLLTLP